MTLIKVHQFYTCSAGKTFWGCCKTNACSQGGCPDGDLEPAILNREDLRSAYHATGGSTMTSATRTSTASATSVTRTVDAQTSSATASAASNDKTPVAAIAGGAAGGAFALAAIITLLVYYCCHAKKSRRGHTDTVVRRLSDLPAMMAERDKAGLPDGKSSNVKAPLKCFTDMSQRRQVIPPQIQTSTLETLHSTKHTPTNNSTINTSPSPKNYPSNRKPPAHSQPNELVLAINGVLQNCQVTQPCGQNSPLHSSHRKQSKCSFLSSLVRGLRSLLNSDEVH